MKHILPILTLTTLAAAASAQSAAAAGLSYNRAGFSYNTDASDNGYSVSVEALVGSSNVWVGGEAGINAEGADSVSVGYLFKNVIGGIDATAVVSSNDTYGVILRRSLNEIVAGLEGRFVYAHSTGAARSDSFEYELAYNVNSKYQVAVSVADVADASEEVSFTVRYNY